MQREIIECCASCKYWKGWFDDMFCELAENRIDTDEGIKPYEKCKKYKRDNKYWKEAKWNQ